MCRLKRLNEKHGLYNNHHEVSSQLKAHQMIHIHPFLHYLQVALNDT